MIDHLMAFADEATAKADAVVGSYWHSDGAGSWDLSCTAPNIFVWVPANDVGSVHTAYDGLWRIIISLPTRSTTLSLMTACHLIADRDAANAGQPFILQSVLTDVQLATLMLQPLFAGSNYPFGHPSP